MLRCWFGTAVTYLRQHSCCMWIDDVIAFTLCVPPEVVWPIGSQSVLKCILGAFTPVLSPKMHFNVKCKAGNSVNVASLFWQVKEKFDNVCENWCKLVLDLYFLLLMITRSTQVKYHLLKMLMLKVCVGSAELLQLRVWWYAAFTGRKKCKKCF